MTTVDGSHADTSGPSSGGSDSGDETPELPFGRDGGSSGDSQQTRLLIEGRVRERLFGSSPAETGFGRFTVLEEIGRGGMGTVFAAFDQQLDRKVALKVLHDDRWSDTEARLRSMREAQAMARLSHPNVATVHEVGESGGTVFLAMEFIRGQDVASWIRTEPSWREVVDVFIQAGQGLRAAHEAGLVHRDLKPHNIMRSDDGVVKVLDFGLARAVGDELGETEDAPTHSLTASSSVLAAPFTQTGSVMGTPAYMSPEQLRGESVDARSDQFSFCVALFEALYGKRPYEGTSVTAPREAGARSWPPPSPPASTGGTVPASVHKALLRGLEAEPDARWPSMEALLEPLRAAVAPRPRRFVVPLVAAVGLLGVGAGLAVNRWERPCSGSQGLLDGVWDDARREELRAAILGSGRTFAASTLSRVEPRLDEYARSWVREHTEACEATEVRHEQSEAHMDLRMSCLQTRRQHLRATVGELVRAEPATVEYAVQAVSGLPALSRCADIEALTSDIPPPEDPEVAQRVAELEAALVEAEAKLKAREYEEALAMTEAVASDADVLGYEPLSARAWLLRGRLQQSTASYEGAIESLERAYGIAMANRMVDEGARASVALVLVLGSPLARHEQARSWTAHAEPLSRAAASDAARARYLDAEGELALHEGKLDQARDSYERALAIRERSLGPDHPEVAVILGGLGTVAKDQGELEEATAHHTRALAIFEQAFGPDHPEVAGCLQSLGNVKLDQGELEPARELYQRGLAIFEDAYGPEHPKVGAMVSNLGSVASLSGEIEQARRYFERALVIDSKVLGPDALQLAYSLSNLGMLAYSQDELSDARDFFERAFVIFEDKLGADSPLLARPLVGLGNVARVQGNLQEALDFQLRAAAIIGGALGPDHPDVAHPLTNQGRTLLALGEPARAIAPLERALSIRVAHGIDPAQAAETRFYLASALWDAPATEGGDRSRALQLAKEARDVWAERTAGWEETSEALEAWLAPRLRTSPSQPSGEAEER